MQKLAFPLAHAYTPTLYTVLTIISFIETHLVALIVSGSFHTHFHNLMRVSISHALFHYVCCACWQCGSCTLVCMSEGNRTPYALHNMRWIL